MKRIPLPHSPNGWFKVVFSDELAVGDVRAIHQFGRDLVVFRGEDGAAHVLDAYCPHLGAHLGVGGKVVGNAIQCPFHGWRWDGAGACTDVPYAKKIPALARIGDLAHARAERLRHGLAPRRGQAAGVRGARDSRGERPRVLQVQARALGARDAHPGDVRERGRHPALRARARHADRDA